MIPPTSAPTRSGSRVTAIQTAALAASSLAAWGWSAARATPAAPTSVISAITLTDTTNFSMSQTCPGSLAAGANCAITIDFTPSAAGTYAASVDIADNASGNPQAITLKAPAPPLQAPLAPPYHSARRAVAPLPLPSLRDKRQHSICRQRKAAEATRRLR